MKSPAFQFYPGDWRRDLPLRCCSPVARCLWLELMCLMHEGAPYGHLATTQGPIEDPGILAGLIRMKRREVVSGLEELEAAKVFSRTPEGVIYSRRMVRDEDIRQRRAAGGRLSAMHPRVPTPKDRPKDTMEGYPSDHPSIPSFGGSPSSSSSPALKTQTPNGVLSGTARRCLAFLNEKTGRSYRPARANLALLEARLKDGATEANIRGVIARKVREWQGDPKMAVYLRPKTLFNATNFEQYLGERAPEAGHGLPPVQ